MKFIIPDWFNLPGTTAKDRFKFVIRLVASYVSPDGTLETLSVMAGMAKGYYHNRTFAGAYHFNKPEALLLIHLMGRDVIDLDTLITINR